MVDVKAVEKQLKARLKELGERSEVIEADLQAPLDPDFEEQANELEDQDAESGIDAVIRSEISQIELALSRIEDGDYGECANCGNDIAEKRLEAQPTAILCIDCATAAEAGRR